ncbi:Brefeldin A-inhibited guanine nucleotide-exchange protein 3 [Hibiscus syriacus]|uniref:Brefeldin A-inhibited guanine nucleotide-exchange protein 3 n=1 Tax=Hibiscus syriacus TaxID=106335 RepID=A0A6A3D188_HIBSY|nr:Brefeldin A-inhibited guanine nucleotide-exchange protein 3 [Hibiscus syriacus]
MVPKGQFKGVNPSLTVTDSRTRHISGKTHIRSVYYAATDVVVLRFMVEVCWAPMLAAFSVSLDQSDNEIVIELCLEGFRYAIHAIVTIADEDGNYLQEAWEHILTCVSRFEHLHLLGEGAPPDATFFSFPQNGSEKPKQAKSTVLPVLKKKGPGRIQNAAASVMRGSYDSAGIGGSSAEAVTSEQMSHLVSNLNMLEQVGEMNRIFTRSKKLNSEAIIDFVKALCKVSMEELRSTSDPRVFSLTKIVEIAHHNMNRIRLVWSNIWLILSDFFVTIGCSENLSIAIFAMDSLRQLSMKFLEREELANYNFQNDFMKPFVVVMRKSGAVEIRELIIRCVSQMVFSRVNNVKSGWKSMFIVFTTAAYDDHKNIVLSFNKDISLNAIAFLRFCTAKLAEEDLGSSKDKEFGKISPSSPNKRKDGRQDNGELVDKDNHLYFWFPLLAGLSELSFDPRPEIRKSALQVLFETLRNHGHLFSLPLWERVFESVLFPIFDYVRHAIDPSGSDSTEPGIINDMDEHDQDAWLYETCTLALQLVVDLFVNFYNTVNPLLRNVLSLLVSFIKRPHQSLAGFGIAAFVRLMSNAGDLFSEEKWMEVVSSLKEAANAKLPDFSFFVSGDNMVRSSGHALNSQSNEASVGSDTSHGDSESLTTHRLYDLLSDAKCRAAVQLLLIQTMMEIYNMYRTHLSTKSTLVLFEAMHTVASHAHRINNNSVLCSKLQEFGPVTQLQDPPLLHLENESYQFCLTFLQNLILDRPPSYEEVEVEAHLVDLCQEILQLYIETARPGQASETLTNGHTQWVIPLGSGKRRELAARAPLVVMTMQAICSLGETLFEKNLPKLFTLISSLISAEHGSNEVQVALSDMLSSSVGPVLFRSCLSW